jgi:hypothetical protein
MKNWKHIQDLVGKYGKKTWRNMKKICTNPSHNPPMDLYIEPGTTIIHTCPGCGQQTTMHGPDAVYLA